MAADGYRPRPRIPDGKNYPQGASPPITNRLHVEAGAKWYRDRFGSDAIDRTEVKPFVLPESSVGRVAVVIAATFLSVLLAACAYFLIARVVQ